MIFILTMLLHSGIKNTMTRNVTVSHRSQTNPHNRKNTVNLEIFAGVLFLRNCAYGKFSENKTLANGKITVVH